MEKIKPNQKYDKFLSIILKFSFTISCIGFAIPSIIYLLQNKTIFKFKQYFKFLLNDSDRLKQSILYFFIIMLMTILYTLIIKNREKIFKNIKSIFIFILIISSIFIVTIPFMCSDVFYYLGTGRLDQEYSKNPYYITLKEFVSNSGEAEALLEKDTVLYQGFLNDWSDSIVVYGALWAFICKIIAFFSFGNIDIGVLVFKIVNLIIHMINCLLLYKISNKKKIFVLLYGICPFILIEGICSVHNDIFVLMFLLGAIYFVKNKKNILGGIILLALATAIKYFAVLFLPFLVLYHFKAEKIGKKILYCILSGLFFVFALIIPYLIYIKDLDVFAGLFIQQTKIAKSIYVILLQYFTYPENIVDKVSRLFLGIFFIVYVIECIDLLIFKKMISLKNEMRTLLKILFVFIFLLITQFQGWYMIWLYSIIVFQKSDNIKLITQSTILTQFANMIFLLYGENWKNGVPFVFLMFVGILGLIILNKVNRENRKKLIYLKQLKKI